MTQEELLIKKDRMRFVKNKLPANLALLAIVNIREARQERRKRHT